ncbi:hypothetical protein L0Y34_00210 [Candidatus Parcubacteria bacterium]|nr:hypothetical protein [Candidatus Parcubacteria bacterium]
MVHGILRTLSASIRGLHQAAYLLAGLTLVSQVLALLRDRIFVHAFGAGHTLDLYYAAFRIPDLVFALIASLVSAYVLIPRLTGGSREESERLISHSSSFLLIVGGLVCLLLCAFMPEVLSVFFPQFAASSNFVFLARMLLLQPILLGLSGVLTSVTQVHRRFILFALSPVLYNAGIIIGALFLYPVFGLQGLGVGVLIGALLHLLIHVPIVSEAGLLPRLVVPSPAIMWSVVKDSVPRSFALTLGALSALLLSSFAAGTGEGGMTVFSLAGNVAMVPLALIGASYATAAFPVLAAKANGNNIEAFTETLSAAARHLIFWSVTAALLTLVLRAHLVRVILGTGAFDWDATRLTAALLGVLIIGLVAQGLVLLASRAFYAARRSWNPLVIQFFGLILSGSLALSLLHLGTTNVFVRDFMEALLRIEDIPGSSVVFVALGATLGQLFMGVLAFITLRDVAPGVARSLLRPLFEALGAGMVGATAAYGLLSLMGNIAPLTTLAAVFTQGLVAGMVGLAVAGAVLALLENREFKDLYESLKKMAGTKLPPSAINDQTHT